jgi:hypothetical protein
MEFRLPAAIEMACTPGMTSADIKSMTKVGFDDNVIAYLKPPPETHAVAAQTSYAFSQFVTHYSPDVVYPFESLCVATGLPFPKDDAFTRSMSLSQLESRLQPEFKLLPDEARQLKQAFTESTYIVFNFRKEMFQLVNGLQNGLIASLLIRERGSACGLPGPMRGMVHNWFSMLDTDGAAASASQIKGVFRGCFTPEFYPMRFIMKDAMYEQQPVVLAVLLNHVAGRYDRAGVSAAELSISVTDVTNPYYLDILNKWTFATPLLKPEKSVRCIPWVCHVVRQVWFFTSSPPCSFTKEEPHQHHQKAQVRRIGVRGRAIAKRKNTEQGGHRCQQQDHIVGRDLNPGGGHIQRATLKSPKG